MNFLKGWAGSLIFVIGLLLITLTGCSSITKREETERYNQAYWDGYVDATINFDSLFSDRINKAGEYQRKWNECLEEQALDKK